MPTQSPLISEVERENLKSCEKAIGYEFKNILLLKRALTHASVQNPNSLSNERLEFLGDAILGLVACEYLYSTFRDFDEGDLTLVKSEVVSRTTLARIGRKIHLQNFFSFGGNQFKTEEIPDSVLANIFEAIVGAMYLDDGIDTARRFILENLTQEIESFIRNPYQNNYKSLLQFIAQKYLGALPNYQIINNQASNAFTSYVTIGKRKFPAATGKNKKESEQGAAEAALQILALEESSIAERVASFAKEDENPSSGERLLDIPNLFHNSQSLLQYVTQKFQLPEPIYHKTKVQRIDEKKIFFIHVSLGSRAFPCASNEKYKEAQRLAARTALEILAEEYSNRSSTYCLAPQCLISNSVGQNSLPFWYSQTLLG